MGKWVGTKGGETCSQNILHEKNFLKKIVIITWKGLRPPQEIFQH